MAVALLIEQVLKRILVVTIVVSLPKGGGVGNCHTVITVVTAYRRVSWKL
jgi:hypothetical protein